MWKCRISCDREVVDGPNSLILAYEVSIAARF
jgi:hypothetical protein